MSKLWTDITPAMDAVILPPSGVFCNTLTVLYINEDANDGNGSMEIETLDAERILRLCQETGGDADAFFKELPDLFHGEWHYCDNTPETEQDFRSWVDAYFHADFICGKDGDEADELRFLVKWALRRIGMNT